MSDDIYNEYIILEKLDILGQGIIYFMELFFYWLDLITSSYEEDYNMCFFYYLNGNYFYNAIALEDKSYYIWKLSKWARNYPFTSN